jgi:hypothetical protein
MRGAEERDLMFGRLFGYLALIRSGKLSGDNASISKTLDTLIELHLRKAWIREVISESLLFLLDGFDLELLDVDTALSTVAKLNEILPPAYVTESETESGQDMSEVPAHLLVLLAGLQAFEERVSSVCDEDVCAAVSSLSLPRDPIVTVETFSVLTVTLLAACSGFPKVCTIRQYFTFYLISSFGC